MPFAASLMIGLGLAAAGLKSAPPPAMKRAEWMSGLPTPSTRAAADGGVKADDEDKIIARVKMK